MPPNGAEGPQAQQYEQIHNPNLGAETTAGQELRSVSEQTDKMHVAVQRSQKEINNNAHWGPFQQAERLYQQAFTTEFVGNDPARHFARPNESRDPQDPNGPTKLAFERLNKALQTDTALQARVRSWKVRICEQINKQWRNDRVDWTAGPGLDTNANFDAQKGQEYRDIRPDQQVIEGGLREYNQALQKFYQERTQAQPGRPARPPTMVDMFNFKIDWCNKKNAELDKQEQEATKQGVRPADGRFYAGLAWSPTIAWVPGGRSVAGRLQPRPAEGPQVQAKTQGETEAQAKAKGSEDAEQRGKEGVAKEGRVKEAQAKEGQTKEQTEKEVEEKNKADEAKAKAEAEAKAKEDLVRHAEEIRTRTTAEGAEPIADLDARLQTPAEQRADVLQDLVNEFQARQDRLVDIAIVPSEVENNIVLRFTPRPGQNARVSNILRTAGISPALSGTITAPHSHAVSWDRALMAVNVFRGNDNEYRTYATELQALRDTTRGHQEAAENHLKTGNNASALASQISVIESLGNERRRVNEAFNTVSPVYTDNVQAELDRVDNDIRDAEARYETVFKTRGEEIRKDQTATATQVVEKIMQNADLNARDDERTFTMAAGNPPAEHTVRINLNRGPDIMTVDGRDWHLEVQTALDPQNPEGGTWGIVQTQQRAVNNGMYLLSHHYNNEQGYRNLNFTPAQLSAMALDAAQGRTHSFEQGALRFRLVST